MSGILVGAASGYAPAAGGGGGVGDIISENFETTGTPPGWYSGFSGDWDYTASPLNGSQSLRCAAGDKRFYNTGGSLNHAEIWFRFLFKAEALPAAGESIIEIVDPTQSVSVYRLDLQPTGTLTTNPDSGSPVTVSGLSVGTIYNIWGYYKSVSVNNSLNKASFATVGNPRPNSGNAFCSGTHGFFAQNAGGIFLPTISSSTAAYVFDDLQVASTDVF